MAEALELAQASDLYEAQVLGLSLSAMLAAMGDDLAAEERLYQERLGLARRRWFARVITWWFILIGSLQLVAALAIALDDNTIKGFVDWATIISSSVSGVLIVIGIVRLPDLI